MLQVHSPSTYQSSLSAKSLKSANCHDLPNCQQIPHREYYKCNLDLLSLWSSPCRRWGVMKTLMTIMMMYINMHNIQWLFKVHALLQCVSSNLFHFWKQINILNIQLHFVFERKSTYTTFKWLFKVHISFLKVNQHAQHLNGSLRFMLFYNVYLQIHYVFERKSTYKTFKWLFKVHIWFLKENQHAQQSNDYLRFMLQCVSSNIFRFWK